MRRIKDLNDANVMKHIWNLFYRKDSLWGRMGAEKVFEKREHVVC